MSKEKIKFVFFGSSRFSGFVLDELKNAGYLPVLNVTNAKEPLPEIPLETEVCIVASFGKILPGEYLRVPKKGFINVHPSLLPDLRGPSPIQNLILQDKTPGVTIIKVDEKMDHGPILAQEIVELTPWPDHYDVVEERLARAGGKLLVKVLENMPEPVTQDDSRATYIKLVKKEDGLIDLNDSAEINLRKVFAYSTWPGAYFFFQTKNGKNLRVVVKDAEIVDGKFTPTRIIPEGKREMVWQDFLRGN